MENVLCMCNKANWKSEMNSGGISTLYTIYVVYIYACVCFCVCVCGLYKYFVLLEFAPKSSQRPSFGLIASDATSSGHSY